MYRQLRGTTLDSMQRKRLHGGSLKAAGYDEARQVLEIEFANGQLIEYAAVGHEIARRLLESQSPWSYYRDNIEDEFTGRPAGRAQAAAGGENPFG